MDSCIADSISQRTAYILKTLGPQEISRRDFQPHQEKRTDYVALSTAAPSREFTGSKSDTSTTVFHKPSTTGDEAPTSSGVNKCRGKGGITPSRHMKPQDNATVKSKSSSAAAAVRSNAESAVSKRQGFSGSSLPPPAEGSVGGGRYAGLHNIPNNLPHYDTFFSPKSYQPVNMFHLSGAAHTPNKTIGSILAANKYISRNAFERGVLNSVSRLGSGSFSAYPRGSAICNNQGTAVADVFKNRLQLGTLGSRPFYGGAQQQYNSTDASCSYMPRAREQCLVHADVRNHELNCPDANASRVNSTNGSSSSSSSKISGDTTAQGKPSSSSEDPDHNNNFYKGGQGIFFCNRKPMPGCGDVELTGPDRINVLAQPKMYPCPPHRQSCCARKVTPESMQRIELLAQPKLCHYTVCSCCLSHNCLGECSTRFNVNRTTCHDPGSVNWERLAKPRRINPPPTKQQTNVIKTATLNAKCSKRTKRLAVPLQRKLHYR